MINAICSQEVLIYVVDADTKQLISKNFKYNCWTNQKDDDGFIYCYIMFGGILNYKNMSTYGSPSPVLFNFEESQVTEFGYDFSSITGNVIEATYDSELDGYIYPSVAIIYMSKLK